MSNPLRALFLDMDSYFASVEQHLNPSLLGKPVGVVPVMADSSCCIAASYEAKAFGVKTGTSVKQARELCQEIQFVVARHAEYVKWHHIIVDLVESCIHVERVMSIDEMLCWLPYNWRDRAFIEEVARQIKSKLAVLSDSIRCSIGVAPNGWLAKIASKQDKPNGVTIWEDEKELPEVLFEQDLSDLQGIGKQLEMRLRSHGLHTVKDLYLSPKKVLRGVWGSVEGERIWHKLRGEQVADKETKLRRTVGHSHVLPPTERFPNQALSVMHRLTQKAVMRMRNYGLLAGGFEIQLRYLGGKKWTEAITFQESADALHFSRLVSKMWSVRPYPQERLLKVSILLFKLVMRENYTPSLFTKHDAKRENINLAMDHITTRFGKQALYFGNAHKAIHSAPMRIAFNHIPDVKSEE